ncbi:alpha,alpha-trehalose-phosphate synthase [Oceaniovalibus guishaninsula JLT2003]|uniref:Alpha,alpha-trehalose-phosphate synthase n=1 Tax=Oceaniovalibus guishaninsula JLT2003 TaxID=1231392 RepID=K2HMA8_9RHOB|nr:HAD-IIB family hydrolase [Oceaniovalibus guishaninsula]EKE44009.1 alpha,alpha-trehalose-phosphate synthase [Oceaniovalibus guishaninsula JLT2003]
MDDELGGKTFVLATDLDGTFLGGSAEDRRTLYDWIEENRDSIGLIFVTGRDPGFIADLCKDGVPWPDYVVGDVGTTIARMRDGMQSPMPELEAEIAAAWDDAGERVRDALRDAPGLTLQSTDFRYRVSYDLDAATFERDAIDRIDALGLDHLISDNRYFDVLPPGISKGPSLKRLVAHLGVPPDRVLAAGDTLNDLSMIECGLPAVVVGGAEQALVDRVAPLRHVHIAEARGAGGIMEAIRVLDLHPALWSDTP